MVAEDVAGNLQKRSIAVVASTRVDTTPPHIAGLGMTAGERAQTLQCTGFVTADSLTLPVVADERTAVYYIVSRANLDADALLPCAQLTIPPGCVYTVTPGVKWSGCAAPGTTRRRMLRQAGGSLRGPLPDDGVAILSSAKPLLHPWASDVPQQVPGALNASLPRGGRYTAVAADGGVSSHRLLQAVAAAEVVPLSSYNLEAVPKGALGQCSCQDCVSDLCGMSYQSIWSDTTDTAAIGQVLVGACGIVPASQLVLLPFMSLLPPATYVSALCSGMRMCARIDVVGIGSVCMHC